MGEINARREIEKKKEIAKQLVDKAKELMGIYSDSDDEDEEEEETEIEDSEDVSDEK